ncbi:hypothetical protein CL634_03800 [bacterium]|nr:hypothetical protein [bacterium]
MDRLEFENFEINAADNNQKRIDDNVQPLQDEAIQFSSKVIEALSHKIKEHNSNYSSKVNANQLKKVYRRGAMLSEDEKGLHAMARVNMFLRMKQEGKIVYQKPKVKVTSELKELVFESKSRIKVDTFIDVTENWLPTEKDFIEASEDIKVYKLNYDFKDINELYLDDYKELDIIWG